MSHTILIDETNGNGLFSIRPASTTSNVLRSSVSTEDLSQSLSEYTDADESMSAPTEFLAEFLSAVMLKDYKKAFKYCKLILQYEPNNATAKEFYPLIQEKLRCESSSDSDENYNKSSSAEIIEISDGGVRTSPGARETSEHEHSSSAGGSDSEDVSTSDSDENHLDASNSNVSTSTTSRSDNTTHSYSSLLLEDDEEIPQVSVIKEHYAPDLDLSNGNFKSPTCSDSESPTEPLTQRIVAILRSKCVTRSIEN